jgi:hypothetical protein
MQSVEINIDRGPAGTADAGDKGDLVLVQGQRVNRPQHISQNRADAAAGTPDVWEFFIMAKIFIDQL